MALSDSRESAQQTLPGLEEFQKPDKPVLSHNARRVLEVIQGYSKGVWGYCGAFVRTLRAQIGHWVRGAWKSYSVRWIETGIAELKALGYITVQLCGPHAAKMRVTGKGSASLLQSKPIPSSINERVESKVTPRKPQKRTEPDWDAMDRADIETYRRIKLPRQHWPVHLREFAEVA